MYFWFVFSIFDIYLIICHSRVITWRRHQRRLYHVSFIGYERFYLRIVRTYLFQFICTSVIWSIARRHLKNYRINRSSLVKILKSTSKKKNVRCLSNWWSESDVNLNCWLVQWLDVLFFILYNVSNATFVLIILWFLLFNILILCTLFWSSVSYLQRKESFERFSCYWFSNVVYQSV